MICQQFGCNGLMLLSLPLMVCVAAGEDIVRGEETEAAIRHRFSDEEEKLLDEVQFACFQYFWKEVGTPACLVKDRLKAPVSSIAAVGFQLSSLPIGVERGWVKRAEGEARARAVLQSLSGREDNKKFGIYIHYPDYDSGGLSKTEFVVEASTVDHALLLAGAITAASYFGGEVSALTDRMIADSNWKAYAVAEGGWLSMGWKPDDPKNLSGPGKFIEWHWHLASDEERLIYLLAAGAPKREFAVPAKTYYRLKREVRRHGEMAPYVVSWPGTLFTYFFSHCWIDYRALGADDPEKLGVKGPRVDWFENSRRATRTHRARCIEAGARFKTLSKDRWGLSACAARDGYIVPEIRPNLSGRDDWHEGTVAPYAAASCIMFTPAESMEAIRAFRELKRADGTALVWREPKSGGYGFVDSFNMDQRFESDDYVGIDQGPMLLAIENVRSGLIWKLFMDHESVKRGLGALKLR